MKQKQGIFKRLLLALTFQESTAREDFILTGAEKEHVEETSHTEKKEIIPQSNRKKPMQIRELAKNIEKAEIRRDGSYLHEEEPIKSSLAENRRIISEIYSLPKNKDIIIREFTIALDPPAEAFALFIEGISDKNIINNSILKPLMILSRLEKAGRSHNLAEHIKKNLLHGNEVEVFDKFKDVVEKVNYGVTAVFIDGCKQALAVETKGWDKRPVESPKMEQVIRGPHEAFNETLRSNTGLIRKALRNPKLITEFFKTGARNKTDTAIMYLEDIASPALVEEVKRRLSAIRTDYVGESGVLEQFIEDQPFMAMPQVLYTERPDRVVASIIEGRVAILMDNSPNVLIVPTTIFSLLHSPEDYYLRMPYANLVRILRVVAIFIAVITPSLYVAITTFHQEMIPTDLMLAIAAARTTVPFPTVVEVFFMEFAFELIREAGVRVPGIIGNTIGIVGALILGQAAVQAGIVSPILIIVVAITGLASFAIPNYAMSFAFRGIRFIFTALAAIFGFFGISAGLFSLLVMTVGTKSFGVPMLSPIGPRTKSNPDLVQRGPMWSMEDREDYLEPQDRHRQPNISRGWLKKQSEQGKEEKDE